VCILSSLLSDNVLLSLKGSLFYVRIGIFALLISYIIDQNKKILDYFYYTFLITFSALIVDGYFQYFTNSNLFGYKINQMRVSSFFGSELILGSYLVRLLPLLVALFLSRKNKHAWENYFFSIFLIFTLILIYMSGERSAFFFLILLVIYLYIFLTNYRRVLFWLIISFLFLITTLVINDKRPYNLYQRYVESPFQEMNFLKKNEKTFIFTRYHDSLYRTAFKIFLDKPILGHGPKSYRIKCQDPKFATGIQPCEPHPHNFYIQLLAETGVVGFSFLLGVFIYFIYLSSRCIFDKIKYKRILFTDYQICLLAGFLITIWPFSPNGNIFTNNLMLFYSLQIGFFKKI
jgi:O-antigen ligase